LAELKLGQKESGAKSWSLGRQGCRLAVGLALGWATLSGVGSVALGEGPTALPAAIQPEAGSRILRVEFAGVLGERLGKLVNELPIRPGATVEAPAVRESLRKLYATGLYETLAIRSRSEAGGVVVSFQGRPRLFLGSVTVEGARGSNANTQLEHAAQLAIGSRYTEARLQKALEQMRSSLADNGYHEPKIEYTLTRHEEEQLVDVAFSVVSGPHARVGTVTVSGDAGLSAEEFRHKAHLREGTTVDHNTTSHALDEVIGYYQKRQHLEAEVKLESQRYDAATRRTSYQFAVSRGPKVSIEVDGAGISSEELRKMVPIFEEGAVDEDLLNESNRKLRDAFQKRGYFDVKVEHERRQASEDLVQILFHLHLGEKRRVGKVSIEGNKYFDRATLLEQLSVHPAGGMDHRGAYSQALVTSDIDAIEALYQNNGFAAAKVTVETAAGKTKAGKAAPLEVHYRVNEGSQKMVSAVEINGANQVEAAQLMHLLNTTVGQPVSPRNLAGDREALLSEYLKRGFDEARVDVTEKPGKSGETERIIEFQIQEGEQIFVRRVLLSGLRYTRPETVERAMTLKPGAPLDPTALQEMQRNFYDLTLFSQVDAAVENPEGKEREKTILLNAIEARRWALNYGAGFESQTGTPQNNCASAVLQGKSCTPEGQTGVSPRVLGDLTRNNLFGREQSASIQGTYGLLEQKIDLLYSNPHFDRAHSLGFTFSAGYANSRDVTTYVASRLQGGARLTEHFDAPKLLFSKADTLVYEYNFRRVKVAANSLQVGASEVSALAAAVRVAGPGFTWVHDTRDSALDAHSGSYTSFQEFLSTTPLGAEAQFHRMDLTNSNFWSFGKGRYVLARNTRYGQERSFGGAENTLIPLPERMYAGGTTSMRGFGVNAAGPRDIYTGYPIGGAGTLLNSTEMRLPAPTLPMVGNTVSVVLFHDMGNVFANASDAWSSALRVRQPLRDKCRDLTVPTSPKWGSTGPMGNCSFNYFSHAPGLGLRYHTPVGPFRFDFSYNLNPPIYPVLYDYSLTNPASNPHVGEARHFNFFFSLGQTF